MSLYRDGWNKCLHEVRQAVFVQQSGSLTPEQCEALQAFSDKLKDFEVVVEDGMCPICEGEEPLLCPRCMSVLRKADDE